MFPGTGIGELVPFSDGPLIDANISELAVLAFFEFEPDGNSRFVHVGNELHFLLVVVYVKRDVFNFIGRGKVADHRVQERLNAFVLVSRSMKTGVI